MESDSSDQSGRVRNKPENSSNGDSSSEPRRRGRRLDDSASSGDDSDDSCGQNGNQAEDDAVVNVDDELLSFLEHEVAVERKQWANVSSA